jgi:hypothetical protein
MSKNCAYNNKIYSTCEEVLPRTILSEAPKLGAAESSDFSKMAQLAKLYAKGKPSEKEFQRLKGLISRSLRDSQAPKPDEFRDACLISSTGVPTGKPSKTSKAVSVGFYSGRTSA